MARPQRDEQACLQAYDQATLDHIQGEYGRVVTWLVEFSQTIRNQDGTRVSHALDRTSILRDAAQRDIASVMEVTFKHRELLTSFNERLAARSINLMAISLSAMCEIPDIQYDEESLALGALFHDCSLFRNDHSDSEVVPAVGEESSDYLSHPNESCKLLEKVTDFPDESRDIVAQVHEQIDGTGYPAGLVESKILLQSKLLNLVDAYLQLTEPLHDGTSILSSDAITYLYFHARHGRFCLVCMQALLRCLSIYPVGSKVELSDATVGIVHRSSGREYARPIIRVDEGGVERLVDLRQTDHFIIRPLLPTRGNLRKRLTKSEFANILWRPPKAP